MSISSFTTHGYCIFRWCRNCLHDFAATLFRKRCTKFHENHPSFI